jgi:hypothetical protein
MTQSTDKIQGKLVRLGKMPKSGKLWHKSNELVALKANYYQDRWELSIAGKKIGTVSKVPAWLAVETFEGNPSHIYQCDPYGYCPTKAEAIGRLFAGWLVETKIVAPDIWKSIPKETGLPDYI